MIGNRIGVIALTVASAITGSAAPANAQQQFDGNQGMAARAMVQPFGGNGGPAAPAMARPTDGNWGIAAHTTNGHCGTVQFALAISDGRISSNGGSYGGHEARLSGRVARSGNVQVQAVSGPRIAKGSGRLDQYQGSGTWAGRGPSGTCSGVWHAYRSF
jgi:hypothetical protein